MALALVTGAAGVASADEADDTTAPVATHIEISPRELDVSTSAASITVTIDLIDDYSGALPPTVEFLDDTGSVVFPRTPLDLIAGDALEGRYRLNIVVPEQTEPTTWRAFVGNFVDEAGNVSTTGIPPSVPRTVRIHSEPPIQPDLPRGFVYASLDGTREGGWWSPNEVGSMCYLDGSPVPIGPRFVESYVKQVRAEPNGSTILADTNFRATSIEPVTRLPFSYDGPEYGSVDVPGTFELRTDGEFWVTGWNQENLWEVYQALGRNGGFMINLRNDAGQVGRVFLQVWITPQAPCLVNPGVTSSGETVTIPIADMARFLPSVPEGERVNLADIHEVSWLGAQGLSGVELINLAGDPVGQWGRGANAVRLTPADDFSGTASLELRVSFRYVDGEGADWYFSSGRHTVTLPVDRPRTTSRFFLNDGWGPNARHVFIYGRHADEVFVGDWNGDGRDTIALRRGNRFYVSNQLRGGAASNVFAYGRTGDVILVGDWDGDGRDTLAVRRGNEYHVKNSLAAGNPDRVVRYGRSADEVMVGDWNGDGRDTFAVRRGARYFVKNRIAGGDADHVFVYGRAQDVTLVGDWDGDGVDTFAVRRGSRYHVKNSIAPGDADLARSYGRVDDEVLVGDWNRDGRDTLGVRRFH